MPAPAVCRDCQRVLGDKWVVYQMTLKTFPGCTKEKAAHLALVHSMTPDWFDEDDPAEVARERKREPDPSSSSYACCKSALLSHVETDVLEIGRALHNGGSSASAAVLDAGDDAAGSGALDDALDDGGINGGGADDGGGGD